MAARKRQRLSLDGQYATADQDQDDLPQRGDNHSAISKTKSLFVHSLPTNATTESLTGHFSQAFALKHATVVLDPGTQRPKGYGFVTFAAAEDAQKAKDLLNGSIYEGRKIKVDLAEPRHRSSRGDNAPVHGVVHDGSKTRGEQNREHRKSPKLIVRNLPWSIKEGEQLALLFRSYGKVKYATVPKKPSGLSAGYGFVTLRGAKNAENALSAMNGKDIGGRQLAVDYAVDKAVWETLQEESHCEPTSIKGSRPSVEDNSVKSEEDDSVRFSVLTAGREAGITESDAREASTSTNHKVDQEFERRHFSDSSSTLFVRNVSFETTDEMISEHFRSFGPVRYGRVVVDPTTERSRGTAFVCFYKQEDAENCLRNAPKVQLPHSQVTPQLNTVSSISLSKRSLLENTSLDTSGRYTLQDRVLQVSRAVDRAEAKRLTTASTQLREFKDSDKRRLYLLSEGTISTNSPLYSQLPPSELKLREDSARQRQTLIKSNPALHLSLTRLSVRNLPRNMTSKELKELARKAVVGFASDVKDRLRQPLSKEELARGGEESRKAEKDRKAKGKGIVRQAKIVFEGSEGGKIQEDSGASRSRGYGFIEYTSHRCALMGLRWLNGHLLEEIPRSTDASQALGPKSLRPKKKRLIIEFAIENAQVTGRRRDREFKARERSRIIVAERRLSQVPHAKQDRQDVAAETVQKSNGEFAGSRQPPLSNTRGYLIGKAEGLSEKRHMVGRKRKIRQSRRTANAER